MTKESVLRAGIIDNDGRTGLGRICLDLFHDNEPHHDGRWRWYDDDRDTEVSGATLPEAIEAAREAWGGPEWQILFEGE